MLVNSNRIYKLVGIAAGAALFAHTALAQGGPCPSPPRPYGGRMLDVSRNVTGKVSQGITYFYICQATPTVPGEVTRNTYRQPIHLDLNNLTSCDETKLPFTIDGYYYSQTRMSNPFGPTGNGVRIGWHNGFGTVKNSAGNVIGTAKFEGTIATNTSRAPLPEGNPNSFCYVCGHHTGEITITFLNTAAANLKLGNIKAFYQFDAIYTAGVACDQTDPCTTDFFIDGGTLDGVNFRTCQ